MMLIHMVQLIDLLLKASCFFLQSFLSTCSVAHIATTCLCMPLVATPGILRLRIPSLIILWAFIYLSESLLPL